MIKIETNTIYNENCFKTMKNMDKQSIDIILTSPPYNTSRIGRTDKYATRYIGFQDNKTDEEYIQWTIDLFNNFDKILINNGCILYNISYSSEKPDLLWRVIGGIIEKTNFSTADCITWKKKNALPNNTSPNKLTRIIEYVFVFARKSELLTFNCNKQVTKIRDDNGQKYYENIFNYIEAPNNDGKCDINKSTYSSELCEKLLHIYSKDGQVIYDPFMGTGTTAIGCLKTNNKFIGSEISKEQVEYSLKRINNFKGVNIYEENIL
jgi:site-specific DNA-methyltransferase (adenine-specific)/modification methylase